MTEFSCILLLLFSWSATSGLCQYEKIKIICVDRNGNADAHIRLRLNYRSIGTAITHIYTKEMPCLLDMYNLKHCDIKVTSEEKKHFPQTQMYYTNC